MRGSISAFSNLPWPLKIASLAVGGSGLLGMVYWMSRQYFYILLIGLLVVGLLLLAYRSFLIWMNKRRAAPLEQSLVSHSSATPQGISDPGRVAQLDDLRKKFGEGIQKFRDAGKNIYSLPWYLLVGEPGSGKTEAIRHCNVGFPPGLQDQLQGAGGTLNMNWWFTNRAVIIDTAGRLMFEEVPPGATSEWEEFLKLLKKNRLNCPVNGMLLAIPADSIIKDDANELERKGSKIAQQLDHIQRVLGVRFPVFIVITKCDLINGFREFFDTLTDPQLQHQVLGWSNPAKLDEPFNPADVDRHLEQVREKLLRRRLGLMLDPVPTDESSRTDEVDALYAFPDSLVQIGPRLKSYLEMIFVAGEWSAKPLFLRGIYFTSAMREGGALDADLADVLGVPVESLPEGKVWERNRSFFLKDLFVKKVFVEKRLVTRASNTRQLQTQRKAAVLGAGILSVVLLLLFTWFGARQLENSIGKHRKFWQGVSHEFVGRNRKIAGRSFPGAPFQYSGATLLQWEDQPEVTLGQFPVLAQQMVEQPIVIPWIFKAASIARDYDAERYEALSVIFQNTYLKPVITEATIKLGKTPPADWSPAATDTLIQFTRLEAQAEGLLPAVKEDRPEEIAFDLDAMLSFTLDGLYEEYRDNDQQGIAQAINWLYTSAGVHQRWPANELRMSNAVFDAANHGVDTFNEYWALPDDLDESSSGPAARLAQLKALRDALNELSTREARLVKVREGFEGDEPDTLSEYRQTSEKWNARLEGLTSVKRDVDTATTVIGEELIDQGVEAVSEHVTNEVLHNALSGYKQLLEATGEKPSLLNSAMAAAGVEDGDAPATLGEGDTPIVQMRSKLKAARAMLEQQAQEQISQLKTDLIPYEGDYLAKPAGGQGRAYAIRFDMYHAADGYLQAQYELGQLPDAPSIFEKIDKDFGEEISQVDHRFRQKPDSTRFKEAAEVSRFILRMAKRDHLYGGLTNILDDTSLSPEQVRATVASMADESNHEAYPPWERPSIAATESELEPFHPQFHPNAAGDVFKAWVTVGQQLGEPQDNPSPILERGRLEEKYLSAQTGLHAYAEDYLTYWTVKAREDATINNKSFGGWRDFYQRIRSIRASHVNARIDSTIDKILDAIDALPQAILNKRLEEIVENSKIELRKEKGEISRRFDSLCEEAIQEWMELGEDEREAIKIMRTLTPRDFELYYFGPYSDDPENPGVRYWNDLCEEAVRLLSVSAWRRTKDAINEIIRDSQAFPLCLTRVRNRTLQSDEVNKVSSMLEDIGAVGEPDTIGGGAKTRFDAVNKHLTRITGEDVLPGIQQAWFDQLKAVCESLRTDPPLSCRLVILGWDDHKELSPPNPDEDLKPSYPIYRYLQLYRGDKPFGDRIKSDEPNAKTQLFGVPSKNPEDELAIHFFEYQDDEQAAAVLKLASPWTVIDFVHDPNAEREDDEKHWIVALTFDDAAGNDQYYYWVKLEFNRPIPLLENWPTEDTWPRE